MESMHRSRACSKPVQNKRPLTFKESVCFRSSSSRIGIAVKSDLNGLEALDAVLRYGGFARTAEHLHKHGRWLATRSERSNSS